MPQRPHPLHPPRRRTVGCGPTLGTPPHRDFESQPPLRLGLGVPRCPLPGWGCPGHCRCWSFTEPPGPPVGGLTLRGSSEAALGDSGVTESVTAHWLCMCVDSRWARAGVGGHPPWPGGWPTCFQEGEGPSWCKCRASSPPHPPSTDHSVKQGLWPAKRGLPEVPSVSRGWVELRVCPGVSRWKRRVHTSCLITFRLALWYPLKPRPSGPYWSDAAEVVRSCPGQG